MSYVLRSHGPNGGHDVDDRDKCRPNDSPDVDRQARPPEMEGPSFEFPVFHFADDGDTVRPIQSNSRQVEDGRNGGVRAQTDQIDEHARDGEEPDRVNRGVGTLVDLVPDSRQGQHFVAGVRPDGAGAGLNGRHGREIEDEASGHGEEDASVPANDVVEDLSDGLSDGIIERVGGVAAAVSQHDGKKPSPYPGEAEREGNRPRCFNLRVLDLLGNVSSGVVVGHGPGG